MRNYIGGRVTDDAKNFFKSGSVLSQIILAIIIIVLVIIIFRIIVNIVSRVKNYKESKILIEKGKTICPKTSIIIPGEVFHRSKNELAGIEFSWAFWIYIDDWSYKYGQWKHILHKGNSSSWPNRAPGIWLHPRENTMRFYMNTYNSIAGNYIDIPSIPLNKWFHVVFSVNQITMDVHINGTLRKSHKFTSLPKQNFGDVFITAFRGFDGYLSKVTYYTYSIPYSEIDTLVSRGPGRISCVKKTKKSNDDVTFQRNYLTSNWWTNTYQSGAPQYA